MAYNELYIHYRFRGKRGNLQEHKVFCVLSDSHSYITLEGEEFPVLNGNWKGAIRSAHAKYNEEFVEVISVKDQTKERQKSIEEIQREGSGCAVWVGLFIINGVAMTVCSII